MDGDDQEGYDLLMRDIDMLRRVVKASGGGCADVWTAS